jgi:molybdopterin molybdotransferase
MATSIINALDFIYKSIEPLSTEIVPIESCLGRVLAEEYSADFNLPRFDNSAMDGYAVKVSDQGAIAKSDKVIYAGDDSNYTLQEGEAIRIMTGAPIPEGTEAIVPIEDVTIDGSSVHLPSTIKIGKHIRRAGEDIRSGESYAHRGDRITAYTLAIFASQGVTHVKIFRRVKIAVFGTGDELKAHYEQIEPHQLYNSNAPMFLARAKELGCEVTYIGSSGDTVESLKRSIKEVLFADLIITSGGVSVGDKDFTIEAFEALGMERFFTGIDIKPGKPTTMGRIGDTYIVNLPGNPLAAMVNYEMFVKIIILKLSGVNAYYHTPIYTKMSDDLDIKAGKFSVILGSFDGKKFYPLPSQSPGMVSPISQADAMIVITPDTQHISRDSVVKALPIRYNYYSKEYREIFTTYS